MVVPERAVDGQSLVAGADLVVCAGGTMNREAVVLGTPVYTTFAGRMGGVDERLVGRGRAAAAGAAGRPGAGAEAGCGRDARAPRPRPPGRAGAGSAWPAHAEPNRSSHSVIASVLYSDGRYQHLSRTLHSWNCAGRSRPPGAAKLSPLERELSCWTRLERRLCSGSPRCLPEDGSDALDLCQCAGSSPAGLAETTALNPYELVWGCTERVLRPARRPAGQVADVAALDVREHLDDRPSPAALNVSVRPAEVAAGGCPTRLCTGSGRVESELGVASGRPRFRSAAGCP